MLLPDADFLEKYVNWQLGRHILFLIAICWDIRNMNTSCLQHPHRRNKIWLLKFKNLCCVYREFSDALIGPHEIADPGDEFVKLFVAFTIQDINNKEINSNITRYSRRKYYCYHQFAKYFLLPFKNGNFLYCSPFRYRSSNFASNFVWVL